MTDHSIGLDFGSSSARGVLIEAATGHELASRSHDYQHNTLSSSLPNGSSLGKGWAQQLATNYLDAAQIILSKIEGSRSVLALGLGFTASSVQA